MMTKITATDLVVAALKAMGKVYPNDLTHAEDALYHQACNLDQMAERAADDARHLSEHLARYAAGVDAGGALEHRGSPLTTSGFRDLDERVAKMAVLREQFPVLFTAITGQRVQTLARSIEAQREAAAAVEKAG